MPLELKNERTVTNGPATCLPQGSLVHPWGPRVRWQRLGQPVCIHSGGAELLPAWLIDDTWDYRETYQHRAVRGENLFRFFHCGWSLRQSGQD